MLMCWLGLWGARAEGQEPAPRAALMRTAAPAGDAELAGALDRFARSALDDLEVVTVSSTLALDIEQAQLALGCMAESPECMKTVADENEVTLLLAPRIDQAGDERVLTILLYDDRNGELTQSARRVPTAAGADGLLDRVPGLLRELFGLPPVSDTPDDGGTGNGNGDTEGNGNGGGNGTDPAGPDPVAAEPDSLGAGGPTLLAIGGAALLGGVVAGVLHMGSASDYEDAEVNDPASANAASAMFDEAQRRGRAATGLLIGGGVLAGAGLVWLLVDLMSGGEPDEPVSRIRPGLLVSSRSVGASMAMEFGR